MTKLYSQNKQIKEYKILATILHQERLSMNKTTSHN